MRDDEHLRRLDSAYVRGLERLDDATLTQQAQAMGVRLLTAYGGKARRLRAHIDARRGVLRRRG